MTTPVARRFLFALRSRMSASSRPFPVVVDALAGLRRNRDHFDVAAPVDGLQALFGQLLLDALRLRFGFVDLIDRNDDRNVRRSDVRDRLLRLRHDAVVGGDHQDRNVGDLRTASAHGGKRLVTGRIDERNLTIVMLDRVRTDALRDAARFTRCHVRATNLIEQRGFTVIDVAQDGDDRGTHRDHFGFVFFLLDGDFFAGFFDDRVETELFGDGDRDVTWNILVDRRHRADLDRAL